MPNYITIYANKLMRFTQRNTVVYFEHETSEMMEETMDKLFADMIAEDDRL